MKKAIIAIVLIAASSTAATAQPKETTCFRTCASWDTFCKSPAQIVATKCRLGVPVKHGQCELLGLPSHYMVRGGGSLVEGMPCTAVETNKSTEKLLENYI